MRISGSTVVVTGASSGIGRATALAFARRGANLVLVSRDERALRDAADECAAVGAAVLPVPCDTTDGRGLAEIADRTVETFGGLDVWINDAAVAVFGPLVDLPPEDVARVLDVNVMGYVHGARAALPHMIARGGGVLINLVSVAGIVAQPYGAPYSMSKFAVRALTSSVRQELRLAGVRGVHACAVLPPTIDTPFFAHAANHSGRRVRAMPPVYPPEQVARVIVGVVRRPRREVAVGLAARALVLQARLAPRLTEYAMARLADRAQLSRRQPAADEPGNLYRPPGGEQVHGEWHGRRRTATRRVLAAAGAAGVAVAVSTRRTGD
ncbi:MAG TPA: SDR family oxidoreductase [Micromonosporaceae bacterium]